MAEAGGLTVQSPFTEFALLLLIAAAVGVLAVRLRQPVLVAWIAVGIAVGPAGLELVSVQDQIDRLAQLAFTSAIGFMLVLVLAMGRNWLTALYAERTALPARCATKSGDAPIWGRQTDVIVLITTYQH